MSSEIRTLFPEMGPLVGYAVTCVIRAEPQPLQGHRASTYGWWDYVQTIPAPRVVVVHDLAEPRGQGAQWGEVQANIHKALGCVGVVTDGSVRDLDEVRGLGFQFAAAHVSVSHAYVHMVDFGLPVKVGGLWVKPGDLIHCDQHGAVTIPAEIADALGGRHRLLTPDPRGRADSDKPASGYSLAHHAADLRALLDHFRLARAILMGHSLGAHIAVRFATLHPDRVSKLVLFDGGLDVRAEILDALAPAINRLGVEFPSLEKFLATLQDLPMFAGRWNDYLARHYTYDV